MPIRKSKPTSPGRRFATFQLREELTGRPRHQVADRGQAEVRRAKRPWAGDVAPPGRRRQAPVSPDRLQAAQGRCAGEGRHDRVRPEPHLLHRPAPLRGRPQELHPRAAGPEARRSGRVRRADRHPAGQRAAAARDPDRDDRPQRRADPRPGRSARPSRRRRNPGGGQGGRPGHPSPSLLGDPDGAGRLPRHRRCALERRAPEREAGQGRAGRATRGAGPRPVAWR